MLFRTVEKIKIIFVLGKLDNGGTEGQLIETLRRLNRDRFELRVLAFPCHGELRKEIETLRIPLKCLGFSGLRGRFQPESFVQLYRLIRDMVRYFRQEKPHIVQSYLFWANIYGCIAAKIAGVQIIITGRRGIVEEQGMKPHYRWLRNLSNFWTTTIITNSRFVQQHCLQQEKYVTPEKIRIIYNGVDLNRYIFDDKNEDGKTVFNIPADYYTVGIVANLRPCKGFQDFLKAAARVLQTYPKTLFLLVGRDEGIRSTLETLAKNLGISNSVLFTGERNDIPELLAMFDILVSSSLTESLSNAILEGMAEGKPVVTTDVGGTSELVVHEQTGLLVPPQNPAHLADAIMRLLGDQGLRSQLGNKGRHRAATLFPIEHMINQTEALYDKLVDA